MARSEKKLTAVFTDTANAIRAKKGTSAEICPLDFADEIASIPGGTTLLTPNCPFGANTSFTETLSGIMYSPNSGWAFPEAAGDGVGYWMLAEYSGGIKTQSNVLVVDSDGTIQPGYGQGTTIKLILPFLSPVSFRRGFGSGTTFGQCILGDGSSIDQKILDYTIEFYTMDNVKIGETQLVSDAFFYASC